MSVVQVFAAALIVASLLACVVAVIASAADAARVAARGLQARAERRLAESATPPTATARPRGPHTGGLSSTPRPRGGRRSR